MVQKQNPPMDEEYTMGLHAGLVGGVGLVAEGCPLHSPTAGTHGSVVTSGNPVTLGARAAPSLGIPQGWNSPAS